MDLSFLYVCQRFHDRKKVFVKTKNEPKAKKAGVNKYEKEPFSNASRIPTQLNQKSHIIAKQVIIQTVARSYHRLFCSRNCKRVLIWYSCDSQSKVCLKNLSSYSNFSK